MSKINLMQEKAVTFDKVGVTRAEVNKAVTSLKEFRQKFPFTENLASIEWLDPDKLFKVNPDEVGELFRLIEGIFKPLRYSTSNSSNVYRNARLQIKEFRNLLRVVVDDRKSLAQKVDASWERIGGFGDDKQLAFKIIFSFNYEKGKVLPVFNMQHLRHFANRVADGVNLQTKYLSQGQEYEHYTAELLKAKGSQIATKNWDLLYFAQFLYKTYPPPDSEPNAISTEKSAIVTDEQLDLQGFMKLLGELQRLGKITGEQFREHRAAYVQQKPNDREVLVLRLKQLLKETPLSPRTQSDEPPKRPTRQRL
jgi:hypothetical protein